MSGTLEFATRQDGTAVPGARVPHREGEVLQVGIALATSCRISTAPPRRGRRRFTTLLDSSAVLTVFAHGIVGRADLPIPETMFGVAAAAVLVLSFAALATLWSRPRLQEYPERRLFPLPAAVDVVLGIVGVAVFVLTAYAGLAGTDAQRDNLAPTMVYVAFWVGVPFVSLLVGDVWRLLSPWRAIGRGAGWLAQRVRRRDARADGLPGAARPLARGARAARLRHLRALLGRGARSAPARGDHARLHRRDARGHEPVRRRGVEPQRRRVRPLLRPLRLARRASPGATARCYAPPARASAPTRLDPLRGTTALLVVGIGVTAFDGAAEGPVFNDALPHLQDFFAGLGFSQATALELGFVVGLLAVVALIGLIWTVGVAGMPGRPGPQLVHSLVPIVAAYVVAHYFSLLAYNGQDVLRLLSDPLGDGSDLLGTAQNTIDYCVVSATAIWYVQVVALVDRPRRGARARARPRARHLRQPPRRDALAGRHARRDGLLHLPGPVPALRGQRMIAPPFAHAGHWLAQLAYLAPLILLVVMLVVGQAPRAPRAARRRAGVSAPDGPAIDAAGNRATGIPSAA